LILRKAVKQSPNVIMDLRRLPKGDLQVIRHIMKIARSSRSLRKLWVISKQGELIKIVDK